MEHQHIISSPMYCIHHTLPAVHKTDTREPLDISEGIMVLANDELFRLRISSPTKQVCQSDAGVIKEKINYISITTF